MEEASKLEMSYVTDQADLIGTQQASAIAVVPVEEDDDDDYVVQESAEEDAEQEKCAVENEKPTEPDSKQVSDEDEDDFFGQQRGKTNTVDIQTHSFGDKPQYTNNRSKSLHIINVLGLNKAQGESIKNAYDLLASQDLKLKEREFKFNEDNLFEADSSYLNMGSVRAESITSNEFEEQQAKYDPKNMFRPSFRVPANRNLEVVKEEDSRLGTSVDTSYVEPSFISDFHFKDETKDAFKPKPHPLSASEIFLVDDLGLKNASLEKQKISVEPKSGGDSPKLDKIDSNYSSHDDPTMPNFTASVQSSMNSLIDTMGSSSKKLRKSQALRKEPEIEFFEMTVLAFQLCHPASKSLMKIDRISMLSECRSEQPSFHEWPRWINAYLTRVMLNERINKE